MPVSARPRPDDSRIDLGTGVNLPLIAAAIGLGLLVLAAPLALYLLAGPGPAPPDAKAPNQRPAAPQRIQTIHLPAPDQPVRVIAMSRAQPASADAGEPSPLAANPLPTTTTELLSTLPAVLTEAVAVPAPILTPVARASATREPVAFEIVAEAKQTPWPFKHRLPFSVYREEDLRDRLYSMTREVDLESEKGTSAKLLQKSKVPTAASQNREPNDAAEAPTKSEPILDLLALRDDLKGLPLRNRTDCQVAAKEAAAMQKVSRELRREVLRSRDETSPGSYRVTLRGDSPLVVFLEKKAEAWRDQVSARMLSQMIQAENLDVRLQLVKMLSAIKGQAAGTALAQRAVFDLSPEVREAAVKALKDRPRDEARSVLVEALRYPWAPVADHAAEALVALDDQDAALDLALLVDLPDPQAPRQDKNLNWVVSELVRVNHLGNCLLCHAPSRSEDDPVRGVVPERGKQLPPAYYESRRGDFVRADVTYIKQDFSIMHSVFEPEKWPRVQRFDYVVRKRELRADELERLLHQSDVIKPSSYPQREAVLWALRQLTGEDARERGEDWYDLLLPGSCADPDI
jgi:hypothetical protein